MRETLRKINEIFSRRMKLTVIAATFVSVAIALLDTAAIALVYPVVELAVGGEVTDGVLERISVVLGEPEPARLTIILTVTVVTLFVVKDVFSLAYSWWLSGFKAVERVKLQTRVLQHFLGAPYTEISRRSSSDMIRALFDAITQLFGSTVFGLMSLVSNVVSIFAIVAALLIAAPVPTVVVLLYFGLTALVYFTVIKPIALRAGQASAEASMDGWRTALAALGGIKELSLRQTGAFFIERFHDAILRGARAGRTAEFIGGLPRYLLEILFILAIGVFLVLATQSQSGAATLGAVSVFVVAGFRVIPSVTGLLGNLTQLRFGAPYLDIVVAEIRQARLNRASTDESGPRLPFTRLLEVDGVSFRYPSGGRDVLQDVSISVPHGASVALVGSSGAGKTTLVDIILGLHKPTVGRIIVDGVEIAGRRPRWQQNLGYVAQDIFLLDATLAENIAFDKDRADIDPALLTQAIRQAQLEELVAELPDGVESQLGERGARLSGGQRQRVGIARALYRRPELLVLDEATSALDNETEHRISQTIAALHGQITVIIIAHRLSTIRHCDQVVFLSEGRVDAVGTFDEVRARSAEFARLAWLGSLDAPFEDEAASSDAPFEDEAAWSDARAEESDDSGGQSMTSE